jgi:hypothetical protein
VADIAAKDSWDFGTAGLVGALQRLLRPLVRLLIARGISFPVAAGVLRQLYVEVAVKEFPVPGKSQTDSRITLLTGVHRKDVRRLRAQRRDDARLSHTASLGGQLIARWMTLPDYHDAQGRPRPLPRLASKDGDNSFEALVRAHCTDIRPRAFLDEWLRLGIVHVDEDDRVVLDVEGFVPGKASEEMVYFFGRNVHDHLAAGVSNLLSEGAPFLERSVHYTRLTPDAVAELTEAARVRALELLRELNAQALRLQQREAGRPDTTRRWTTGVYVFSEDETQSGGGESSP